MILTDDNEVTGLNLDIDGSIEKLCEVANSTSGNTRSIWYIIVIVASLSFAELWNTHPINWTTERIKDIEDSTYKLTKKLTMAFKENDINKISDTVREKHQLKLYQDYLNIFRNASIQNIKTVRIPILSNAFDVNDLGIFSGFAFIVLLLMLKFTLNRKVSNLKIALTAITKRYPDDADKKFFEEFITSRAKDGKALKKINLTRRKYHYNFLSMNEIFNISDTAPKTGAIIDKIIEAFRRGIFFIPFWMSVLLLSNNLYTFFLTDADSILEGWSVYKKNYTMLIIISLFYITIIYLLSRSCKNESNELEELYVEFKTNQYQYPVPA